MFYISRYSKNKKAILYFAIFFLSIILAFNFSLIFNYEAVAKNKINIDQYNNNNDDLNELKLSASGPNAKPLLVHQYANITKTYTDISSGENVSFTLVQDWTSENVTLNYEGISIKKQWITNSEFLNNASGWSYKEIDTNNRFDNYGGAVYADYAGNPVGSLRFQATSGDYFKGDTAYFYQNISIPHELSPKIAMVSMDFNYNGVNKIANGSMYIGIVMNGIEANKTIHMNDITTSQWTTLNMYYNPVSFGQSLPGEVTVKYGIYVNGDCSRGSGGPVEIFLDNLEFELWSKPNQSELIKVYDVEFLQNSTCHTTTYGEGYSFIEGVRTRSPTDLVVFTLYQNINDVIDFTIDEVTIVSFAEKIMNTTIDGQIGSQYTHGDIIIWDIEFSIFIPIDYISWLRIDKPNDFSFTSIKDGYNVEQIGSCIGISLGSTQLIIPNSILQGGTWKCKAISENYIVKGHMAVWKGGLSENCSSMTYGDKFLVNITLNNTISLTNTQINLTICYPNGTIFYNFVREPTSYTELFGNFTVDKSMSVGQYTVITEWTNDHSYDKIDKVGYIELEFSIWHHTNLTAIDSYIEKISGDPCLIKVNYIDCDFGTDIAFATVTFNSTFGQSGSMLYMGSGTYIADLDTSGLGLGDYYFSVNASKSYYQKQITIDLIHLKIIGQPLALEVPKTVISGMGNNYISCRINVTGAFSGTLIWPANISTDWQNPYSVTNHNNGTFTLNFSTWNLPTHGIIETFTISVFANKAYYGNTTGFIAMTVYPIQTVIETNMSILLVDLGNSVNIKVNYTIEGSEYLITGANCSVIWPSLYNITSDAQGFVVCINTVNLSIGEYNAIFKLEKPGFETAYKSITVIINRIDIEVNTIDFQDSIEGFRGETIILKINLTESGSEIYIENASVFYSWEFGLGYFEYNSNGIYELELKLPGTVEGNYKMSLFILKEDSIYKSKEFSFIISIRVREQPNYIIWITLFSLLIGFSILGILSLRTYVILPIIRKKESELLAKTQKYKDTMNIEAIVISNRVSGLQIYSKSYHLFKEHQNDLLSGFIQAITIVSNEIIGKEKREKISIKPKHPKSIEKVIELDFKYFNFFICDYKDMRLIFILKEKASDRFKDQTAQLLIEMDTQLSDQFVNWNGVLDKFSIFIPSLLNQYIQLYYRDKFKLNNSKNIHRIKKEGRLSKMELRVLNVIISIIKNTEEFYLEDILENIHEKNKDKVIKALELLIEADIVISSKSLTFKKNHE